MINLAPKLSAAVDRGKCGLSTCGRQAVATAAAVNLIKGLWQRRNKWAITSLVSQEHTGVAILRKNVRAG